MKLYKLILLAIVVGLLLLYFRPYRAFRENDIPVENGEANDAGRALALDTTKVLKQKEPEQLSEPANLNIAQNAIDLLKQREQEQLFKPASLIITPDTIAVKDGRLGSHVFRLDYHIANPERVTSASIRVYSPGIGYIYRDIKYPKVPVQKNGSVYLSIYFPSDLDFGPKVRFRVSCPEGTTDWVDFGSDSLPFDQRNDASLLQIGSVTPNFIQSRSTPDYDSG
jgi:hypothetical protein